MTHLFALLQLPSAFSGGNHYIKVRGGEREAYSFAKTPLKAAQAPLAAARANHEGDLKLILSLGGSGGGREPWVGVKEGRRGSAAASIKDLFTGVGARGGSGAEGERLGNLGWRLRFSTCSCNFIVS